MDTYIQTGLGILVSVLLFLVGYRQTIGARKERIKSANEKLLETILRRIILEKYTPKKDDIIRLIEGKARDYKVKHKDLLSVDQILNTVYTRIFENDLISQEQRDENIERLSSLFIVDKKEIKQDIEQTFEKSKDKTRKVFNLLVLTLGLLSSIIGVSIVSFDKLVKFDATLNSNILLTMIGSLIATFTVYLFLRFKDNQESSDENDLPRNPFRDFIKFEKEVVTQLKKLNIETIIPNGKDDGYDLIALINNEKVAIEIKYWKQRAPFSYIRQIVARLQSSMEKSGIKKGYIVTNDLFGIGEILKLEDNIQILSLSELKDIIRKR
nr:restriction endonuclease [uncultured Flavobacterium sp.]